MDALELLDSGKHATLRMRPPAVADSPFVRIVTAEALAAAASCPVLLSKHAESGAFYMGALLGFRPGELLADSPDGQPAFRPLEADREGFFAVEDSIAVDRAHGRFAPDGEPMFDAQGAPAPLLRRAQAALGRLMAGNDATEAFIAALLKHRLVEPIDISLSFDDGEKLRLEGLYTVSLDAIGELDDDDALALFRSGQLQLAYAMAGSLHHIALMARRRNERLAQAA